MRAIKASALKVGKCYLTNTGRVWRIRQIMPDGRELYEQRLRSTDSDSWAPGMLMKGTLPAEVVIEREVPCDLRRRQKRRSGGCTSRKHPGWQVLLDHHGEAPSRASRDQDHA